MAYSDFDLKSAIQIFDLKASSDVNLFERVVPLAPSAWLERWLTEFGPITLGVNTEKARSEFLVTPILAEARRRAGLPANILSGVAFDVDRARGLTGFCDFLIARSDQLYYIQTPVVAVVEAKKEDLIAGLGQCAAEMVAIRLFNEKEGSPIPAVPRLRDQRQQLEILEAGRSNALDRPARILRPRRGEDPRNPGPGHPRLKLRPSGSRESTRVDAEIR